MPETAQQAPRRLRATDVIETLEGTIQRLTERHTASAPQVAVDFTRNAKGETQIGVKVTANMDADREALAGFLAAVYDEAETVYERATRRYPTSTGTVTNDAPPKGEK